MGNLNTKMTALADEIRELSGTTTSKSIDAMTSDVNVANTEIAEQTELLTQIATALEGKASGAGGVALPPLNNPAVASDILSGKEAIDGSGNKITGTIASVTQATPSVSIDTNGKITASATQSAGYVSAGTKSGTKQLTTQAAKTITPSTASQTAVAKNVYTTGVVTVGAIPSNYEDVTTETGAYTTKIGQLETAISALETELEGKASGGSGGSGVETCTVTVTCDGGGGFYAFYTGVNSDGSLVARASITKNMSYTVACNSTFGVYFQSSAPIYTGSGFSDHDPSYFDGWQYIALLTPIGAGDIATLNCIDDA